MDWILLLVLAFARRLSAVWGIPFETVRSLIINVVPVAMVFVHLNPDAGCRNPAADNLIPPDQRVVDAVCPFYPVLVRVSRI